MKKVSLLFILTFLMVVITGCGSKTLMTCTRNDDQVGVDIDIEEVITYENNKIIDGKITTKANFEKEEAAEKFMEEYQKKDDVEVKKDGKLVTVIEKDNISSEEIKLEDLKESFEEDGWKCNISK